MFTRLFVATALVVSSAAFAAAPAFAGKWALVSKDTPHGEMRMEVAITQSDRSNKISVEMVLFGNKVAMAGEATDNAFTVKGRHHDMELTLTGKLKTDGTLEGFLSTEQGDLTYSGTRVK